MAALAADLGVIPTLRTVRPHRSGGHLLSTAALLCVLSTVACRGCMIISTCHVRGTVQAADGAKGVPCTARLTGEPSSDAQPVGVTGEPFTYVMSVGGSGPPLRASIVLACTGYRDTEPQAFEVHPGRLRCEAANVGTLTVGRSGAASE
jgi:hypothetical protein